MRIGPHHGGLSAHARIPGKLVILAPFGGKGFVTGSAQRRPYAAVLTGVPLLAMDGARRSAGRTVHEAQ